MGSFNNGIGLTSFLSTVLPPAQFEGVIAFYAPVREHLTANGVNTAGRTATSGSLPFELRSLIVVYLHENLCERNQ